jgi:Outer membrane protein beta-barrel domain
MNFSLKLFGLTQACLLFSNTAAFAQDGIAAPPPSEGAVTETTEPTASAPAQGVPSDLLQAPLERKAVSCTWSDRRCAYPHLVAGLDAGVGHFSEGNPFGFKTSTGSVTYLGPTWGARFGAEFKPWFAVEAHYLGFYNRAHASVSVGGRSSLITNAIVAELRFTAPTPYVQPYLFFGAGLYSTSVGGSAASTELTGSTELGVPLGIGVQVLLPRGFSVGAEATYHRFFNESFSENEEIGGGEPTTGNLVLRARF